jgi:hypothetical protein
MAYLSQRGGTRKWRIILFPVGIIFAVLSILDLGERKRKQGIIGGKSLTLFVLLLGGLCQ